MDASFNRLFGHLAWADGEFLAVLDPSDRRMDEAIKLFGHIVAAEFIWLNRIHSRDIGDFTPWRELSLPVCATLCAANAKGYVELVRSAPDLQSILRYKTTKGDAMETPLGDILLQVALHGSYHRGQIASRLRSHGFPVPTTDFIHFSRQNPIEADPASHVQVRSDLPSNQ